MLVQKQNGAVLPVHHGTQSVHSSFDEHSHHSHSKPTMDDHIRHTISNNRNEAALKRSKGSHKHPRKVKVFCEKRIHIYPEGKDSEEVGRSVALMRTENGEQDPFFVMNVNTLVARLLEWKKNLPRIEPFFAVKCNDDPVLMKVLARLGCGFDVASQAEFNKAVKLVPHDKIVYANPIKSNMFIKHAKELDIKMMTFDTIQELEKVKRLHPKAKMIMRIATNDSSSSCPLSVKFGCEVEKDGPKILAAAAQRGIQVVGISFHVGSGCHNASVFKEAITQARTLFDTATKLGHKMKILDIGGGFPGLQEENELFANFSKVIGPCVDELFPAEDGVRIIAEPGRYFATAPYSLVTNIIGVRTVPAERIAKDGGIHGDGFMYYMNDGVYGSFNNIFFDHAHPEGRPLFDQEGEQLYPCTIWGPTCDGLDQVEKRRAMPRLSIGDWLYYENMGAYTHSAATTFNGFEKTHSYYFADEVTAKLLNESPVNAPLSVASTITPS